MRRRTTAIGVYLTLITAVTASVLLAIPRPSVVRPLLPWRCEPLGGARQTLVVAVPATGDELLRIEVAQRGLSVISSLADARGSATASSPLDLFGSITLTRPAHSPPAQLRIASRDSADVTGEVCAGAEGVGPAPRARAEQLLAAAGVATYRGDWQGAFDDFSAAARTFDRLRLPEEATAARHAMAELAYSHLRRGADAIALAALVLSDRRPVPPEIRGARLMLMAKALAERPDAKDVPLGTTHALLRAAARAFRDTPVGIRELPRVQILEGFLQDRADHPEEAERLLTEAARSCRLLRDWECFARARQDFAVLAEERQNYAAALAAFDEALDSLDAARAPKLVADISYNLGRLQGRVGLAGRSEQAHRTAMRLYARLGYCARVRRSASSLGEMLVNVGSIGEGAVYLERVITLSCPQLLASLEQTGGAEAAGAAALPGTGRVARSVGDEAYACVRGPAFSEATLDDEIAVFQALLSLSEIARLDGNLHAAALCLSVAKAHALEARTQVRLANAQGQLLLEQHAPGAAQRQFTAAARIAEAAALGDASDFRGVTQLGLAEAALLQGEGMEALRRSYAALRLSSDRGDISHVVAALRLVAASYAAAGNTMPAIQTLRVAVSLIEQAPAGELDAEMRATYLATQHAVFAELTDLLVMRAQASRSEDQGAVWDAFEVAEQGQARSLRYALDQASVPARATASPPSDAGEYRALLRALADLPAGRNAEGDALLERIAALKLPQLAANVPLDRGELAGRLRAIHAELVEYAVGREDMFAFVTDGAHIRVARLGNRAYIAQAASELNEQLRAVEPAPARIRAAARQLSSLVLWPIRSSLPQPRLIMVPTDALLTIPFAVLPWSAAGDSELLLQHAAVSTVPSAIRLARAGTRELHTPPPAEFLLLGDPVLHAAEWYRVCEAPPRRTASEPHAAWVPTGASAAFQWERSLPSLPGSRTEVLEIAALLHTTRPAEPIDTLLHCSATGSALRRDAPHATLLHIATHGLVDARRPRLSALALTPSSPTTDDAAFRLLDILGLPLHARLVVLSACDTSRGRLLPGEGVLGLAQAFLQAGADSVLATYWRVEDSATVSFMQTFYHHLLVDRLPATAALRQTQLEQLGRESSYAWAAFGLYGRPDSQL